MSSLSAAVYDYINATKPFPDTRNFVLLRELGTPLEFDRERNGFYFSKEWYL